MMGRLLAVIFSNDVEVIARAAKYLKGFAPETVITSVLVGFAGCYNETLQDIVCHAARNCADPYRALVDVYSQDRLYWFAASAFVSKFEYCYKYISIIYKKNRLHESLNQFPRIVFAGRFLANLLKIACTKLKNVV